MNIAFIGTKGLPAKHGGVERYVEELAIRLAKEHHTVTVYSRSDYSDFQGNYNGVRVIKLFAPRNKYINMVVHTLLSLMHILIHNENYDIIHIHGADMAIFAPLAKLKAKVIVTSHGKVYQNASTVPLLLKWFSRLAEFCYVWWPHTRVSVSRMLSSYYSTKYRVQTHFIPVGIVNRQKFVEPELKTFGLAKKGYILFVGRIIPTKKVDLLIDAYVQLKTDKKLVVVGDAPYENSAYCQALKHRASDQILFLGFRYGAILRTIFRNCSLFVLPSESEGLPVVLLEALSYGCVVLASDIDANLEVLEGKYGFTFKSGSSEDLHEKLEYLLNYPKNRRFRARDAIRYVQRHYKWDNVVRDHLVLYKSLIDNGLL